jgi:hypothetical protein
MARARTETLRINDESYSLRWDMNAIASVEELTGENALLGFQISVRNIRAVLWSAIDAAAAAKGKEAPITLRQLGSLFETEEEVLETIPVVTRLIGANMPQPTEEEKVEPDPSPAVTETKPSQSTAGMPLVASTSG